MNLINKHFNKDNMHHAYLIEGMHQDVFPEILKFMKNIGIETTGNPDFSNMQFDSFKIDDARNLKYKSSEKAFSLDKKIYVISINNFLLDAQNALLKMFEEPIEDTHFFIIVPNIDILLKTLISRFYLISGNVNLDNELSSAKKFISMTIKDRISYIKDLLTEEKNKENIININTSKSKALKFLNALEILLHKEYLKNNKKNTDYFDQIFKVREFIIQPGSSIKNLMESVALNLPIF